LKQGLIPQTDQAVKQHGRLEQRGSHQGRVAAKIPLQRPQLIRRKFQRRQLLDPFQVPVPPDQGTGIVLRREPQFDLLDQSFHFIKKTAAANREQAGRMSHQPPLLIGQNDREPFFLSQLD
jgi:hypothetical protein